MRKNAMSSSEIPVRIPEELLRELKWLAEQMGTSPSDALQQAIATASFLFEEIQQGGALLVKRRNGEMIRIQLGTGTIQNNCQVHH
jgi:hypothetical protein